MSAPDFLARANLRLNLGAVIGGSDLQCVHPVWFSDEQALAHTSAPSGWFEAAYWLDLKTRTIRWDDALSDRVNEVSKSRWMLSPDRKWLLFHRGWGGSPGGHATVAVSLSDRRRIAWPETEPPHWRPGTRRWLVVAEGGRAIRECDIDRPGWYRRLRVTKSLAGLDVIGGLSSDRILVGDLWNPRRTERGVSLWEVDLESGRVASERSGFRAPVPFHEVEADLSPRGDRLLWTLRGDRIVTLATSRVDGSGVRMLGSHRLGRGADIRSTGWLPSGRAIFFNRFALQPGLSYRWHLYTLEVE